MKTECKKCGLELSYPKRFKGTVTCPKCGASFTTCKMVTEQQLIWLVEEIGYDKELAKNLSREDASKLISYYEDGNSEPIDLRRNSGYFAWKVALFALIVIVLFVSICAPENI